MSHEPKSESCIWAKKSGARDRQKMGKNRGWAKKESGAVRKLLLLNVIEGFPKDIREF